MSTVISNGGLDVYDNLNGSVLLAWGEMLSPAADSYNVYVNGVLVANVTALSFEWLLESGTGHWELESGLGNWALEGSGPANYKATATGLTTASYNAGTVAAASGNSARPQNMPPTGVGTPSSTYTINVVAVSAGVEVCTSHFRKVTPGPASIQLRTPMKRLWPFPNTGLD
jgi:hypothetical protein